VTQAGHRTIAPAVTLPLSKSLLFQSKAPIEEGYVGTQNKNINSRTINVAKERRRGGERGCYLHRLEHRHAQDLYRSDSPSDLQALERPHSRAVRTKQNCYPSRLSSHFPDWSQGLGSVRKDGGAACNPRHSKCNHGGRKS
jgi:hypothetical protein